MATANVAIRTMSLENEVCLLWLKRFDIKKLNCNLNEK
jgi:hypothetical protein